MSDVREQIYLNYKKQIFNYFYKATLNYHTAEDLTEDTFFKIFKSIDTFREESSLKTWIFKIARNTLCTHFAKNNDNIIHDNEEIMKSIPNLNNDFDALEKQLLINEVMYKLKEEERTIIILREVNGLSYLEISKVMNFTEGKVKIGLHRAKKKFKALYLKDLEG
ncbi:RNA polymerase sigma factor [Clostridium tarantellae]|uniref:RNA polymerase sigma factor n=1 Tax=Clostridium tarantellae TaxID=39493 RepID=UPI0014790000|nr:RNA polymerase sigma factor [Clostridium tarantellae]